MRKLLIVLIFCAKPVWAVTLTDSFELSASAGRTSAPSIQNTYLDVGAPIGMVSIDPITRNRVNDFEVKYKTGRSFTLEANYYFPDIRLGLELSRSKNKISDLLLAGNTGLPGRLGGYTKSTSLMTNLYMDFFREKSVNLFVGVGLGASKITTKVMLDDKSNASGKIKPAAQFIFGAKYWLQDYYSVFGYYKHFKSLSKVAGLGKILKSNSYGLGISVVI